MKVLIIAGHPRKDSFSAALAASFAQGAMEAGTEVRQLCLAEMDFDPNVTRPSPRHQLAEADVLQARDFIAWAEHLVFVYPTWWGTMPALLKGFLDRVFSPGFAFEEIDGGTGYKKLLQGKSAQLVTTMDTPKWVYKWIYGSPGHRALATATLQFCGIGPIRKLVFSPVRGSTAEKRERWLAKSKATALKLKRGVLTEREQLSRKTIPWIMALRLQFYPMTWMAYTVGALLAASLGSPFDLQVFWIGYLWAFFTEVATVMSNDYFDYETDSRNRYFGPFTGGSRVTVENVLSFSQLKQGIFGALGLSFLAGGVLFAVSSAPGLPMAILMLVSMVLALGYTVPPLKLCYRGLGELNVSFTHGLAAILCGFLFQGGSVSDPLPWLVGIPISLSVLPSIILSGIPDREADASVSKKTLAVKFGNRNAARLAIACTLFATICAILWEEFNVLPGIFGNAIYLAIPHCLFLVYLLNNYLKNPSPAPRIDGIMATSLTFILWFVGVPLVRLF